jgi:hypothetical protein
MLEFLDLLTCAMALTSIYLFLKGSLASSFEGLPYPHVGKGVPLKNCLYCLFAIGRLLTRGWALSFGSPNEIATVPG